MKSFKDLSLKLNEPTKIEVMEQQERMPENVPEEILETVNDNIPDYLINDPEVVGYHDDEQQKNIYYIATSGKLSLDGTTSILDLGCGRGDLYEFLKTYGVTYKYTGIDNTNTLILAGRTKYPDANLISATYHNLDNLIEYKSDWVFNVGNLNLNYGYASAEFSKFDELANLLEISMTVANIGVTFVLLEDNLGNESYISYPIHEVALLLKNRFPMYKYNINYSEIANVYVLNVLTDTW